MRPAILLTGVAAVACAAVAAPAALALPSNGTIAFVRIAGGGASTIYTVSPAGGTPAKLLAGSNPAWAPSGKLLAFTRGGSILTATAAGRGAKVIVTGATNPAFSNDGRQLAFVKGGSLWIAKAGGAGAKRVFRHGAGWAVATPVWDPGDDQVAYNYVKQNDQAPNLPVAQVRTYAVPGGGLRSQILNAPADNVGGWVNAGVSLSWMPQGDQLKITMTGGPAGGPGLGVGTISSSGSGAGAGITAAAYAQWAPNAQALCLTGPKGLQIVTADSTTPTTLVAPAGATIADCAWQPKPKP